VRDLSCGDTRVYLEIEIRRVHCRSCGVVKQEKLPWLANNPFYTKRFAFYVGRRCRSATVRDVARELRLDWKTVKSLEMEYMREQLRRAGTPGPKVIGIDEISVGKGHNYRIVVSDLVRGRPIWFGGTDRSEKSMDLFYEWLVSLATSNARNSEPRIMLGSDTAQHSEVARCVDDDPDRSPSPRLTWRHSSRSPAASPCPGIRSDVLGSCSPTPEA
jgi:hypothetical protein